MKLGQVGMAMIKLTVEIRSLHSYCAGINTEAPINPGIYATQKISKKNKRNKNTSRGKPLSQTPRERWLSGTCRRNMTARLSACGKSRVASYPLVYEKHPATAQITGTLSNRHNLYR